MISDLTKVLIWTVLISSWLCWLWSRRRFYKFSLKFPSKWGVPFFGVSCFVGTPNTFFDNMVKFWSTAKERTYLFWLGLTPIIYTVDADVVKQIVIGNDFAEKASSFYPIAGEVIQGGMLVTPLNESQHSRKIVGPTLRQKQVLSHLSVFNTRCKEFLYVLENLSREGKEGRILSHIREHNFVTNSEILLGYKQSRNAKEVRDIINNVMYFSLYVYIKQSLNLVSLKFLCWIDLYFHKRYRDTKNFIQKIVTNRQKTAEFEEDNSDGSQGSRFIDRVLNGAQSGELNKKSIFGELTGVFLVSTQTTAFTASAALYLLAMHQEIQQKVFEEIKSVFPEKDFEVTEEDFKKLEYLDMVLKETLRLFPAAPTILRDCKMDTPLTVNGRTYILPKKMQLGFFLYQLHREPAYWGDRALEFNPDNFLPHKVAERHPYAYLPFVKGPRNCPGMHFSVFSIKVLLIHVLHNYSLHTSCKFEDIRARVVVFLNYVSEPTIAFKQRE